MKTATLGWLIALAGALGGCAQSDKANSRFSVSPPPADAGAVCSRTTTITSASGPCSLGWACPDGGSFSYVCFDAPDARGCGCLAGGRFIDAATRNTDSCGDEGALLHAAQTVCGWGFR